MVSLFFYFMRWSVLFHKTMKFALQNDEICLTGQRNLPHETKKMISRGEKIRLTGRKNPFREMKKIIS